MLIKQSAGAHLMEHKLTVITLSLNYSVLTSVHLHSRHPDNLERGVLTTWKGGCFTSALYILMKTG